MAIPFASAYQPINLLNDAIQNQAARQQQGYLQASALNDASVADSLNRIVQQKALEQQSRDRQAHYGLQQQQLANDLAYRNAALREAEARSIEQARQFDKQFGLNERIANAQINNPFYGQKDAAAFGMQAGLDADKYNQEAENGRSEAQAAKDLLDAQHKAAVEKITSELHPWALIGGKGRADLIKEADDAYTAALLTLPTKIKNGDKIRINPATGKYEALRITPPQFGRQPVEAPGGPEAPSAGPVNIGVPEGAGTGTGEGVISQPFARFGGAPEIRPDAAVAATPVATVNPFTAFLQRQLYGNSSPIRTNAPPAVVTSGAANRVFRFDPQRGLVPLQ